MIGMGLNAQTPVPNTAQVRLDFGSIPVYFEENRGQSDARARYVARGGNLVAFVTEEGWTISVNGAPVSMRIVGADRKAQFAAEGAVSICKRVNHKVRIWDGRGRSGLWGRS